MADTSIRETSVLPYADGTVVRLVIADVPPPYESAAMHLQLLVRLPAYEPPLLAHLQSEAIRAAIYELRVIDRSLDQEIGRDPRNDPIPQPRRP